MNRISTILMSLLLSIPLMGQYWQQWVEYDMDVYLDANQKTLTSTSRFLYINNSPDTLDQVLMHLYHNAFNEGTIAQSVFEEYGRSFDPEKGWTGIQIQNAIRDSVMLDWKVRDDTILDITLNAPLLSGDTLVFTLEWKGLLHPFIERSGWKDKQFDLTQWYPKFVVYDENGWHDDPYGDWGEFYGEFGNFTVNLDLPANQIVAATGVVISGDPGWESVRVDTSRAWEEWVAEFSIERDSLLANMDSTLRRKVSFFAENVHDFAWICSEDFVYEHGQWNGIDVHAVFTTTVGKDWTRDVIKWGEQSLNWLSEKFGMFSWPQMTIAKSLDTGGMEYPMIVFDHTDSEGLAVHEVGHNWFYGIFGNDELDDAWLDEGFTTFQTLWYIEDHYPDNDYAVTRNYITQFESDKLGREPYLETDLKQIYTYMLSPAHEFIATHSFDFTNYGSYSTSVYEKTGIMLYMLKNYLGEARFLAGMQLYFSRWSLKHVNEERFIKAMEDASGEELDWFFDQWLHTTHHVDYVLDDWTVEQDDKDHFKTQIMVHNKGGMFVPIPATVYGRNGETASATLQEFRYREEGTIELETKFPPVRVYLDAENKFFDVDRRNNDSQRKRGWRYDFKGWDQYPDDRNLYLWKPTFGYGDSAGLGLGLNVKQVYRRPGNYTQIGVDHNFGSGNQDAYFSFRKVQSGLPFKGTWTGTAKVWRSMVYASLNYKMNWAKKFWRNPLHFLTLKIESTDAEYADVAASDQIQFTRLGVQYELQDDLFDGDYGLSTSFYNSPGKLGSYGRDFSQISIMSNWKNRFQYFKVVNRTNFLANSGATPNLIKGRVASRNYRSVYLNRTASSLYHISNAEMIGSQYYLRGGGRLRAYTDSLDQAVNYLWSNNLDLTFRSIPNFPDLLDFGVFADLGQISNDADHWTSVGDFGFSLNYKATWRRTNWISTLIRPFRLKFEISLLRYEDTEWVSTLDSSPWVFSLSI